VLTPCVGREDVLERLGALLDTGRWVTLTGAPGCGKTLVARHTAASRARVAWVTGHRHRTVDSLVTDCLDALGAEVAPGDSEVMALKRALDGQDLMLVLDGVDAIDGLGLMLDDLVEDAAQFRLLCTATTVAGRPHEQVLRLPPLPVPEAGERLEGPAVELLLARVAAAGGHTVDLEQHGATVRRLLTASGGLPLLLEQLAVQIALIGVSDVAPVDTLAEAVRRSYDLLDAGQQQCFRRLASVGRPVSLDVLTEVCGGTRAEAVQLAAALARRSLVEVYPDGRFDLLPPLREVGRALAATTDDEEAARAGLLRWAERVIPRELNTGAADAPWLADVDLVDAAVRQAAASEATRDEAYSLANRAFSSLYTAMRAREAVDLLEAVLDSGDGPPGIGSQLARRAGICASEVRGTYEGLRLLERAEQHAMALEPGTRDVELARNAAIRAEMHLDAGRLDQAQQDGERALDLGRSDPYVVRQVRRTLMDVHVSRGDLAEAEALAPSILDSPPSDELWIALSARTLLAKVAWEQGRSVEAEALARLARDDAREIHEDRIALLADTVYGQVTGKREQAVETEALPWAVRLVVQLQEARELLAAGDVARAAGRAADIVVLADSSRLGRDAVEARLLAADSLMCLGEHRQAEASYLSALRRASEVPMPLRAAEALDGLAAIASVTSSAAYRQLSGAAASLRARRRAVGRPRPGVPYRAGQARDCPAGWLQDGHLTGEGVAAVGELFARTDQPDNAQTPLGSLTRAERAVAELVAEGLTSRQIAEQLFVSPRTVDAHLSHIFRKLEIASRAKLAALMTEVA
jgi:DNA-binding CsgD family transcriptional regulator/tetratricopeptide (TPR) repeat protein